MRRSAACFSEIDRLRWRTLLWRGSAIACAVATRSCFTLPWKGRVASNRALCARWLAGWGEPGAVRHPARSPHPAARTRKCLLPGCEPRADPPLPGEGTHLSHLVTTVMNRWRAIHRTEGNRILNLVKQPTIAATGLDRFSACAPWLRAWRGGAARA